jgi:LysR family glycine cleavage system transcriptional activator
LPRLERFRAKSPYLAAIQASLTVTSMQQEGDGYRHRMGKGDWEGLESHYLFADELIVVAAPPITAACFPDAAEIAKSHIIFSMESWKTWCVNAGLERDRAWRFVH